MSHPLEHQAMAIVRDSLLRDYFTNSEYLASEVGQKDLAAHLELRLQVWIV